LTQNDPEGVEKGRRIVGIAMAWMPLRAHPVSAIKVERRITVPPPPDTAGR
jgi:hypothetical protein